MKTSKFSIGDRVRCIKGDKTLKGRTGTIEAIEANDTIITVKLDKKYCLEIDMTGVDPNGKAKTRKHKIEISHHAFKSDQLEKIEVAKVGWGKEKF